MPHLQIITIINTADYIQRSITNVGNSVLYGGLLAVLILLFFLRNISATAIIATTIPISVVATFALMYFNGFSLNLMTLGGAGPRRGHAGGQRHRPCSKTSTASGRQGLKPGSLPSTVPRKWWGPSIASTLTTLVVFLPLVFVRGMSGLMFRQLSYVVSFSLACSLGVALTLVPMLASRVRNGTPHGIRPAGGGGLPFPAKRGDPRGDGKSLPPVFAPSVLDHRLLSLVIVFFAFVASLCLIPMVGVELMPATDESEVRVEAEMAVGTRLAIVDRVFQKIESVVQREVPEIENTVSFIGGTGWRVRGSNAGEIRIALKPVGERKRSSEEIAAVLRAKLAGIAGVDARTRGRPGAFFCCASVRAEPNGCSWRCAATTCRPPICSPTVSRRWCKMSGE